MNPQSFKEERDAEEHRLRTKSHLNYNDIDGYSFRIGANWALTSSVVKDMADALSKALSSMEGQISRPAGQALANYNRAVKGE